MAASQAGEIRSMKIALVANYPADNQPSMSRYAAFLERELRRAGHDAWIIYPRIYARKLLSSDNHLGNWLGYVDKFLLFRIGFSSLIAGADIVHICDHSNSVYLPWIKSIPRVITCHDALAIRSALNHFPVNPTRTSGKVLQLWIRKSLKRADRVLYVSQKTRFDFEQLLGIEAPSECIPHALNWPYSVAADADIASTMRQFGLQRDHYILHVGGNDWYKNRRGVLRMFAELRREDRFRSLRLVMVGKPLTAEMRTWCQINLLTDVLELVDIDNEQLGNLYSGAFALLFPSLEEGFGWPVLEAQACGCPVVTSNRPPMTQIAGQGAQFVDPLKPESIHEAARACAENRKSIIDAGFHNLARFSVQDVIRRYEAFYDAALHSGKSTKAKEAP